MTRRRPGGAVRVLSSCARCGGSLPNRAARFEVAHLGTQLHELAVCRECDANHAAAPTWMERDALARDASSAVEAMEFAQRWNHDLGRVQRTARYFLGDARTDALAASLRETYLADRARHDAQWETYRSRVASRDFIPDHGEEIDDDFF